MTGFLSLFAFRMDAKKRNGVHANLPPSKRLQANGREGLPPPPVAPPSDGMEEEDEDVFYEETLLRDGELEESRAAVAALFTKWRRPAVASFDAKKSSIGTHCRENVIRVFQGNLCAEIWSAYLTN